MKALFAALFLWVATVGTAFAVMPDEVLSDAGLEARARALSKELRCMVCQNQSIDDSDAQLAKDLRIVVRERLVAGDSDAAILDFVEARYGAFVLLKPRLNAHTIALWVSPVFVVLAGSLLIWRRKRQAAADAPSVLTADEEARLEDVLKHYKS
jgi:cytochrome c-type biogenesis protein CcmH